MEHKIPTKRARNWIATIPTPPWDGSEMMYQHHVKAAIESNGGSYAGQVEMGGLSAYRHIQACFMFTETKSFAQIKEFEAVWQSSFTAAYNLDSEPDGTQMILDECVFGPLFMIFEQD